MALPVVLVTGCTGLLGRSVCAVFHHSGDFTVRGLAHSRTHIPGLDDVEVQRVDLRDPSAISAAVDAIRPAVIIHTAAERRPDICETAPAEAEVLNIEAVWHVGRAASRVGAVFIHISTDYLFDGKAAPYKETDQTSPLNAYGRQKLRGEYAALASHAHAIVLRVPVIFGPTADLSESAVTVFADIVRASSVPKTVDDWQIRVPTYAPDIARTLLNIATQARAAVTTDRPLHGIFHYSSEDRLTRYELVQLFGELMHLPTTHVTGDKHPPAGAPRPYDAKLDTAKLRALGLAAPCTPLRDALLEVLRPFSAGGSAV